MSQDRYAENQDADAGEHEAADRLSRVQGEAELRAAILALLLVPGSRRSSRAWQIETVETPSVGPLLAQVQKLSGAARLPWLDRLLARMATRPVVVRRELAQTARRVIGARGQVRPLDHLHWLLLRRGLGEGGGPPVRSEASVEVTEWLESDVDALAAYTAFLARMLPVASPEGGGVGPEGAAWYGQVMSTWQPEDGLLPDADVDSGTMVQALQRLQTLSWMQRPIVIRSWVQAAQKASGARLADVAADALRMTCQLLDSPLPPELARHYIELPPDPAPPGTA